MAPGGPAEAAWQEALGRLVIAPEGPEREALVREVLEADPEAPGLTLANTIAQAQARALLADADHYF